MNGDGLNLVIHFSDGRRRKGVAPRFEPHRPFLFVWDVSEAGEPVGYLDVEMKTVAAVFVVHDLALRRTRRHGLLDAPRIPDGPTPDGATRLRVRFAWGEIFDGYVEAYDPDAPAFLMQPIGPLSRAYNIDRVWVSRAALDRIDVLPAPLAEAVPSLDGR